MPSPWQILRDGGLPLAIERAAAAPSIDELAAAAWSAVAERPTGREAEALAAFLFAWHHHWPRQFRVAFADRAGLLLVWAGRQFSDDGRYAKLRRIAIENLAHVL